MDSYISRIRKLAGHELLMVPAVVGRIVNENDEILLVQNRATGSWSIPGGYVEPDETVERAIAREIEEETGYIIKPVHLIGIYSTPEYDLTYPNKDKVHPITFFFQCRILEKKKALDEEEIKQAKFFAQNKVPQMATCCMQKVKDGSAYKDNGLVIN
jgi:ADP-ribose pyrophosphatase YjhB (NUDIX family)